MGDPTIFTFEGVYAFSELTNMPTERLAADALVRRAAIMRNFESIDAECSMIGNPCSQIVIYGKLTIVSALY